MASPKNDVEYAPADLSEDLRRPPKEVKLNKTLLPTPCVHTDSNGNYAQLLWPQASSRPALLHPPPFRQSFGPISTPNHVYISINYPPGLFHHPRFIPPLPTPRAMSFLAQPPPPTVSLPELSQAHTSMNSKSIDLKSVNSYSSGGQKSKLNGSNHAKSERRESRSIVFSDRGQALYGTIQCTDADEFFTEFGCCQIATERMICLENDFEFRVLQKRTQALSGCLPVDVVRPPLKRPDISDDDQRSRGSVISKNGNRRSGNFARPSVAKNPRFMDGAIIPDEFLNAISGNSTGESCLTPSMDAPRDEETNERSIQQQLEVAHKLAHPHRLHPSVWHNEADEHNNGPACSCKPKYRTGPLHNQFEGEHEIPSCCPESNNRDRLFHYRLKINPTVNFFNLKPTVIRHNEHDFLFDGYSVFLHTPIHNLPPCQLLRFNLLYDFTAVEEDFPANFTVRALDMLTDYVFRELLDLLDLNWRPHGVTGGCPVVHLLPRFIYTPGNDSSPGDNAVSASAELLSVNVILEHWIRQTQLPLINTVDLPAIQRMPNSEWSAHIDDLRGTLAWKPGSKPPAIRIDQLDRPSSRASGLCAYPLLVHMTFTPMKLSLSREPKYKSVLKNYMKLQYLMTNKPRVSPEDRAKLAQLANQLDSMDRSGVHRREITVEVGCDGFLRTGLRPDITQFALNMASFVTHVRCIMSLQSLENRLDIQFKDISLLHQALTHPSYRRTDFGTNMDHFQNTQTNCGPRNIEYGDKLQLYKQWRKKGLSKMIQVMSFMPKMQEERSKIYGNERLEFLGDAVIEVITSIHLFFMFPDLQEGPLDAYRQALVQNQHLADLALRLGLHKFLLYTHSVDFCHDSTYTYARSDAFEAVMAAIALDAGLETVDRIFGAVLFGDCEKIHKVWVQIPPHPLQAQCPNGDREWTSNVPMLQKLTTLEDTLGIQFKHLRVLARALTVRKTGYNVYTLGDNQRLEFLGDSILKYVSTDYLFRHFPRHHEGHLSLLKNSLVNKYTQAAVCGELGLDQFVIRREENSLTTATETGPCTSSGSNSASTAPIAPGNRQQNVKNQADLLEAFVGALYVDKDITWVERFCQVCFWPRLVEFILKQEWNDAKSKLQQCCLTFRSLDEDPQIAHYKVLEHASQANNRLYKVGVFFKDVKLAEGLGRTVQSAQMEAAKNALELHNENFKQLNFQKSVISKRYRQPYINKMLTKLETWDEELVERFVGDVPVDGRRAPVELVDAERRPARRKRPKRVEEDEEEHSVAGSWGCIRKGEEAETYSVTAGESDMELDDVA